LEQAFSDKYPLLERIRFLSFVSSNLDEFFEIRVAGLMQRVDSGAPKSSFDDIPPPELLDKIHLAATSIVEDQHKCWREILQPKLKKEKIVFKTVETLTPQESVWLKNYFRREVYPVLTPLAIDPTHPFPLIHNKSLNLIVALRNPRKKSSGQLMAIVPVPRILPRLVKVDGGAKGSETFIFLSDVVRHYVGSLFPGHKVTGAWAFRITRNSDLYVDEEEVENLLRSIEEELHNLRKGAAVRLEIRQDVDEEILQYLLESLKLSPKEVFPIDGPINLYRLMSLHDAVDRPDLKFEPFVPRIPNVFTSRETMFESIQSSDFLLHHPFDSFAPVVDFLRQAADDPHVFAIKLTLYRTSGESPIVNALMAAALNGKQVTALVELKARFDEEANINWARRMEEVGVHVVYGLAGLKTHCKCCLVVRREKRGLRRYAHLGTGNYNPVTARSYTDYSFFTSNMGLTSDVAKLFNTLTGYSRTPKFSKLLVAPFDLHARIMGLIQAEAKNAKAGIPSRIIVKANSLIDPMTINALYEASQAGVRVDLIIRGICGLVPGVKGLSENIRVRSLLGRYLEHSRVYYFENGKDIPLVFLGSADWMPRNFFNRVEAIFPIENTVLAQRVIETLYGYLDDNEYANLLKSTGTFVPVRRRPSQKPFSIQTALSKHKSSD
jgi:polyphosphate kinase